MGRHTSSHCANTGVTSNGATPLPLAVFPFLCIWLVVVAHAPLAVAPSPVAVFPLHTEPLHKIQTCRQHPETKERSTRSLWTVSVACVIFWVCSLFVSLSGCCLIVGGLWNVPVCFLWGCVGCLGACFDCLQSRLSVACGMVRYVSLWVCVGCLGGCFYCLQSLLLMACGGAPLPFTIILHYIILYHIRSSRQSRQSKQSNQQGMPPPKGKEPPPQATCKEMGEHRKREYGPPPHGRDPQPQAIGKERGTPPKGREPPRRRRRRRRKLTRTRRGCFWNISDKQSHHTRGTCSTKGCS